jgi:hypothetical protein
MSIILTNLFSINYFIMTYYCSIYYCYFPFNIGILALTCDRKINYSTCSSDGYGLLLVGVAPVMVLRRCKIGLGFNGYILPLPSSGLSGGSLSSLLLNSVSTSGGSITGGNLQRSLIIYATNCRFK